MKEMLLKKQVWAIVCLFFLLSGCIVFEDVPTPIAESVDQGRVLLVDHEGERTRLKKIKQKDNRLIGVLPGGEPFVLHENQIQSVYLINPELSRKKTLKNSLIVSTTLVGTAVHVVVWIFAVALIYVSSVGGF